MKNEMRLIMSDKVRKTSTKRKGERKMSYFMSIPHEKMQAINGLMDSEIKDWVYNHYGDRCNQIILAQYFIKLYAVKGSDAAFDFATYVDLKFGIELREYFTPYTLSIAMMDWFDYEAIVGR